MTGILATCVASAALKRLGSGQEQLWLSLALSLTLFQHGQ